MSRIAWLLAVASLAAACSQAPPAPQLPPHPTAVLQRYMHNFGFKGNFASEQNETLYIREDQQRSDHDFQFTGAIMSRLVSGRSQSTILRLDKNLSWSLDNKEKQYTECPLGGCPAPGRGPGNAPAGGPGPQAGSPQRTPPPRETGGPACSTHVVKSGVTVQKTGQTRTLNGFATEEYRATWLTVKEDSERRQDTSTLSLEVWTASPAGDVNVVLSMEQSFGRALAQKLRTAAPVQPAGIPPEAMSVFSANFLAGLSEKDQRTIADAAKELGKIKGYPISTKLEWYLDSKACPAAPPAAQPQQPSSPANVVSGLMSSLTGKSEPEAENKPIFGYVEEVKTMKVQPVSDSIFLPPPDYKLTNRS